MLFTEWYIRKKMNLDPSRHPSFWHLGKEEISRLSPGVLAKRVNEWREWGNKNSPKQEVVTPPVSSIIPEGTIIPRDLAGMSELYDFLNSTKKEQESWLEGSGHKIRPDSPTQPTQLSLFSNPKISTLIKALKKVSRA